MSEFTDQTYKKKFKEAQLRSSTLKIKHYDVKLENESYNREALFRIVNLGIETMHNMGMHSTVEARNQCMIAHYAIQTELKQIGVLAELTIGNVVLRNKPFITGATLESLIEEISSPQHDKPQDIHCWLTLKDSSILDFTIYSNLTNPNTPESLDKNYIFIAPCEHDPLHYYEPMLVGNEYLEITGAVARVVGY
jgi:hypothetical protein